MEQFDRHRRLVEDFSNSALVRQHTALAQTIADQFALKLPAQFRSLDEIVRMAIPDTYKTLDTSKSIASIARALSPNIATDEIGAAGRAIASLVGPWSRITDVSGALRQYVDPAVLHEGHFMRWVEQQTRRIRIDRRFAAQGWVGLDRVFLDRELVALSECLSEDGPKKAEARIVRRMRRKTYAAVRGAARRWRQLPTLRRRRRAVLAALRAHRAGEYFVSIPALWPLLDAVAADCEGLVRLHGTRHVRAAKRHASDESAFELALDVFLRTNTRSVPLSTTNRHDVLHGRAINYGTEANSCRLILLLDVYVQFAMVVLKKKSVSTKSGP